MNCKLCGTINTTVGEDTLHRYYKKCPGCKFPSRWIIHLTTHRNPSLDGIPSIMTYWRKHGLRTGTMGNAGADDIDYFAMPRDS